MKGLIAPVVICIMAFLAAPDAFGQSTGLTCGQNHCAADNPGGAVRLDWMVDSQDTDAIYPANCTNQSVCVFRCAARPGIVIVTASHTQNGRLIAQDSSPALCSEL